MIKQLTLEQRYEIQVLLNANHRKCLIAKRFVVNRYTITIEIQRNSRKRKYKAPEAKLFY